MSNAIYAEGVSVAEYTALRRKPRGNESKCFASGVVQRGNGSISHVNCDWIEGHHGPHNQVSGDYVFTLAAKGESR